MELNQTIEIQCDAKPRVTFTPVREPGSTFGRFECWRDCVQGETGPNAIGLVPAGGWIAWDSAGDMPTLGFPERSQAEELCVALNDGDPTRVYDPIAGVEETSKIGFGPWQVEEEPGSPTNERRSQIRNIVTGEVEAIGELEAAMVRARALNGGQATRLAI